MRIGSITATVLALTALVAGCQNKGESEENSVKMSIDEVPTAVRATFEREAGGAPITNVEREDEGGKAVYEAEFTSGGKKWSVEVDESGKVLEKEEEDDKEGQDDDD
jgi:uncharacterized membrane protein YkoI